eukprot:GGOE01004552.1.p1 GENE.GGOE01004552.1~~GGOE01004552.1.p1  ORF type:complete len:764 (-),score=169.89 GGOE01004552.1:286-2577(-)
MWEETQLGTQPGVPTQALPHLRQLTPQQFQHLQSRLQQMPGLQPQLSMQANPSLQPPLHRPSLLLDQLRQQQQSQQQRHLLQQQFLQQQPPLQRGRQQRLPATPPHDPQFQAFQNQHALIPRFPVFSMPSSGSSGKAANVPSSGRIQVQRNTSGVNEEGCNLAGDLHNTMDLAAKGTRTPAPPATSPNCTHVFRSTAGKAAQPFPTTGTNAQPLPAAAPQPTTPSSNGLSLPLLETGVCQVENEKRNELRLILEKNCKALVQALTADEQQSERLYAAYLATTAPSGDSDLLPAMDRERFVGRCLLQEVVVRSFWQKSLEQLKGVHTHDKCNLLSEQQQELTELLSRHARQRAQLRQAHLHQKQEHLEKQDKQLRGLYRSLRHVLEVVRLPDQSLKDKQQDVVQWCDAVLQASPAPKRRRQSSPTPSVDTASEVGPIDASISPPPPSPNGSGALCEPQSSLPTCTADQAAPSWPPCLNGSLGIHTHQSPPFASSAPNNRLETGPPSPPTPTETTLPSQLELLVCRLRKLQAAQEEHRLHFEEEVKEVEEERQMNDYELEIEKLRQQKQQKQQLLFTLHSERHTQRALLGMLQRSGGVKRQASEGEREGYSRFQQHLSEQLRFRQRQLREVRAEVHRVTKVQRYRRWMRQQSQEDAPGDIDAMEEDLCSSSSLTSSGSEVSDQEEEIHGAAPHTETEPKAMEAAEECHQNDDDESDAEDEDEDSEVEAPDPVKVLLCTYDECLTDLVFGEDEDEDEDGDEAEGTE